MPITVPSGYAGKYTDGPLHFNRVFEHLFEPAIIKAGFEAIPPTAKGSDIIHAGIIRGLESADLVLCDMSTLNANVFFEWGVRTALNRPVCVVKDEITDERPFDVALLNSHTYNSNPVWDLSQQIDALHQHIEETLKDEPGNSLWRRFGFQLTGAPARDRPGEKDQLAILTSHIAALRQEITAPRVSAERRRLEAVTENLQGLSKQFHVDWCHVTREGANVLRVTTEEKLTDAQEFALAAAAVPYGYSLVFDQDSPYQGR